MIHHKNWIILAAVVFMLIGFIPSAQAEPPLKKGNPGLPGCLAKVSELEATIVELQEQIATLQASLDEMNSYVRLPQTGQTYIYRPGDDGALQKGVAWPVPRFTDNNNGTVTDNLTRLVWLKNANCFGGLDWYSALISSNDLETGSCGLTDNSSKGDWRLPNRNELLSLVDISAGWLKISEGHPFINVLQGHYWSSSTSMYNFPAEAYYVHTYDSSVSQDGKAGTYNCVWLVRDPK
jgi:hypothetical protein